MLVLALGVVVGEAVGGVRWSSTAWRDDLADASRLAGIRQLVRAKGGGMTIDPAEQAWSIPANARFSEGIMDPTLEVEGRNAKERVVLWQRVLEPGKGLDVASACAPRGGAPCPLDRKVTGAVNGVVHRRGLAGFPGLSGGAAAAGWDTVAGPPKCASLTGAAMGGITSFEGKTLVHGGTGPLAPGQPYAASFSVAADHDGTDAPYIGFEFADPKSGRAEPGGVVLRESEISSPFGTEFAGMTHATVTMTPGTPEAREVRAVARAGGEAHCTLIGPVYLTAQEGSWLSPVFDSLSDRTAWTRVEWEMDQGSVAADPSCACPTPGSPLTPGEIAFEAGTAPPSSCGRSGPRPHPDLGREPVPADAVGRYFRFGAALHGRETAATVAPLLAPRPSRPHFSGWRPALRRLTVRYFARAGEVSSGLVAPASLRTWGAVGWDGETPGASSIVVDVLAEDGTVLFARIPRVFPLAGVLDPYLHPAIRLRAFLACDPAEPGNRPVLRAWTADWMPLPERVLLDRAAFAPAKGERVSGLVAVVRAGRVRVRVYDAAGRMVAGIVNAERPARAVSFVWDGRGSDGKPVKAGTYSVTATTDSGAGTRKVRVEE